MTDLKDQLPKMLGLAYARSDEARVELAGMLADVYLNNQASLALREEEMVNELIDQLMLNMSPSVRSKLVEKFADITRMPRRIAANLAEGDTEVSLRILSGAPTLADEDLIHVIGHKGHDHAMAITDRIAISEAVADALVVTGDVRVMQAVAENLGAHLSRTAVDTVTTAARYCLPLRGPILRRPEMSAEAAMRLYWWVEQDLRRYTLKRFGLTSGQIDQSLGATIDGFLSDHVQQKSNDEVMQQVANWMDAHQAVTPQVLPQVLRMGHFRLFNMLMARMTRLSLSLVDTLIADNGGRGLVSLCRVIGIDKASFVSLFLLSRAGRPGDQVVHPRELSQALALFDRMTPAIAKDLLHSWSVNPEYFSHHKQQSDKEEPSVY